MSNEQPLPTDPITDLAAGAFAQHELYLAWVAAGFTESQAMYLVGQIVFAMVRNTGEDPK